MHVVHFLHRYPPALGGAEHYAARLVASHAAAGDAATVWTSTALDHAAMTAAGRELPAGEVGPVRRYRPLRFPGRRVVLKALSVAPFPQWQALTRPVGPTCVRMWRDAGNYAGPVDAVHAIAFPHSFPAVCGLRLARRRGVPFVVTPFLHLGDPADPRDRTRAQYTSRPLRWLLRQADRVFAQTPGERDAVVGLGVGPDRVVLQGLGVDPAECTGGDRHRARRMWGVADADVVVGHLANLSVEKGSVDLLRTVPALPPTVHLVLAGPAMPNFEAAFRAAWGTDRVIRLGPLTDAGKRDFFAGIDVFCLPSRSDSFGLVLLEAWANGVPVVVYRAGGPADLVRDGVDGVQVRCGDTAGLAAAIGTLAADAALRARLGAAGLARVRAGEFDWGRSLVIVRDELLTLTNRGNR